MYSHVQRKELRASPDMTLDRDGMSKNSTHYVSKSVMKYFLFLYYIDIHAHIWLVYVCACKREILNFIKKSLEDREV